MSATTKTTQHIIEMIQKSDSSKEEVEKLDTALHKFNNGRICITACDVYPGTAGNLMLGKGSLYNAHATAKNGIGDLFWSWEFARGVTNKPFKGIVFVPPVIKAGVLWIESDGTVHKVGHFDLSIGAAQLESANIKGQRYKVTARKCTPSLIYDGTPDHGRQAVLIPRGGGAYEVTAHNIDGSDISDIMPLSIRWLGKATVGRYDT